MLLAVPPDIGPCAVTSSETLFAVMASWVRRKFSPSMVIPWPEKNNLKVPPGSSMAVPVQVFLVHSSFGRISSISFVPLFFLTFLISYLLHECEHCPSNPFCAGGGVSYRPVQQLLKAVDVAANMEPIHETVVHLDIKRHEHRAVPVVVFPEGNPGNGHLRA